MDERKSIFAINLKRHFVVLLLFGATSFLIYSNTLNAGFHFDDEMAIVINLNCHLETFSLKNLLKAASLNQSVFRPLSYVTFALNYYFGQLNVFGYHLVNIVIHLLSGCFLYFFVTILLNLPRLKEQYGESAFATAVFSALLFISNPIQAQAVTYIVQRMASMATMFYLLSLLLYLLAKTRIQHKSPLYFLSLLSGLCAMMSKETAVTLPFMVVLMEFLFFTEGDQEKLKKHVVLFFFVIGVLGVLGIIFLGPIIQVTVESLFVKNPLGIGLRLLTETRVVLYYFSLMFFPFPSRLNIYHDFPISHGWFSPPTTLISMVVISVMIVYAFQFRRRQPLASFCIFWYFGNLVLESTVIPLALIYEHRLYLPSVGVFLLITSILMHKNFRFRFWTPVFLISICILFSVFTFLRNDVWQQSLSLWEDAARKSPENPTVLNNLGSAYMESGRYNEAIHILNENVRINPRFAASYMNLSVVFNKMNQFEKAEENIQTAIALEPEKGAMYAVLGVLYLGQFRYEEAWEAFNTAAAKDEKILISDAFKGNFEFLIEKRITQYQKKIRLHSADVDSRFELGNLYMLKNRMTFAREEFAEILKLQPEHIGALNSMATIYMQENQWDKAEAILQKMIRIDKNFDSAYLKLGMLYLEKNQKARARENLETALNLTNDPERQARIRRILREIK